jgi:LMBR1 domain-containing protein 1
VPSLSSIKKVNAFCVALKYEIVTLVATLIVLLCMFAFLSTTDIPVTAIRRDVALGSAQSITALSSDSISVTQFTEAWDLQKSFSTESTDSIAMKVGVAEQLRVRRLTSAAGGGVLQVTFPIYVMAIMGFLGWFLFVAFGGIGMIAVPFDLIRYLPSFSRHSLTV